MRTNFLKISIAGFTAAAMLAVTSCQDFLDVEPQTAFNDKTAFSSPERVALTIAGMYDAAQSGFYAGGAVRGYPFGAAHVEQGDCRGEDVVNTQAFFAITYGNTYTPISANNDWHFQTLFGLVNRCNVVLAGLETATVDIVLTQALLDSYKGEARFLRALAYHELLKHFSRPYSDNPTAPAGGMPYRLKPITGSVAAEEAIVQGRNTVAECFALMLEDLNYAESVLPETRTGTLRITRVTKAGAVALKMRLYLQMGDWDNVIVEGNKLADESAAPFTPAAGFGSAVISLPANPYAAFGATGSKSNTESIFSIENSAEDNASVNGALPSMYTTSSSPTGGRALVAISPLIWNQPWFLSTDVRKSTTFVSQDEAVTGGGKGGFFSKKYTDVTGRSDNAPVIRYAEVLLTLAEAIQRDAGIAAAPDAKAFALFNAVRVRAVADPATDAIGDFADGTALIQAILNERRIEFLCEGLRWMDIHRLAQDPTFNTWGGGIPMKVSQLMTNYRPHYTGDPATTDALLATAGNRHDAVPYADKLFVWPIPASETNLNPTLAGQQNPGY